MATPTKASLLITLLLLVYGSLALAYPFPPARPCPRNCVVADYMICPPDNTKIEAICTNCCVIQDTGCQLYYDGNPICSDNNYLRLNQNQ